MENKKESNMNYLLHGILRGNPVLILMIGLCPVLAVSTTLFNGIGMSLAVTFVVVSSNVIVSAMKKIIPNQLRIPIFIIVISTFVTITDYVMQAYAPELYKQLGIFVPLIVVNCIVIGRAEAFASKRGVFASLLDGIGTGIGFLIVLGIISAFREFIGNGTLFGKLLLNKPALIMILPPGGFIAIAILMGLLFYFKNKRR